MPPRRKYQEILPAGEDTWTPLNLQKRHDVIKRYTGNLVEIELIDCGYGAVEYVSALSKLGKNV